MQHIICRSCGKKIDITDGALEVKCTFCAVNNKISRPIYDENGKPMPDMTPMSFDGEYKTKILIVRHGESVGNAERRFLGHTDKDLSERGYLQAARTAEFLKNENIDAIYSSSLIRAYNTAKPHAELRGLDVITSDNLREIYAGSWENLLVTEIIAGWESEFIGGWRENFGTYTLPDGESVIHAGERMYAEVKRIAEKNIGRTVLIGTHAAVIRAFFGKILKIPAEELAARCNFPTNASVSVVYYDGKDLIPGEYSHDAHLADI